MNGIDFVLLWVDGDDPAWREAFLNARKAAGRDADLSAIRFRDWQTLPYWFRAVERFAPWVQRIHLITWGHLPAWLDTSHPKLHIVRHEEYLPGEYLPSFNSNTLELNIARIEGLAERFVLFNDDTFLTRPCRPDDFFSREGLPRDMARLSLVQASSVGHIIYNDLALINALHPRSALNRRLAKWFSPRYGAGNLLKTLSLLPWSFFPGFCDPHLTQPYLKRQVLRAWELWGGGTGCLVPPHVPRTDRPLAPADPLRHALPGRILAPRPARRTAAEPDGRRDGGRLPRHRAGPLAAGLPERQRADRRLRTPVRTAQERFRPPFTPPVEL